MCIICYCPAGVPLPDVETRQQMWNRNRDGAGYMTIKNGQLEVRKGFMTFEHFEEFVVNLDINQPRVLHYRIGTNGANTPENTHPWQIDATSALVHNGIIGWLAGDKSLSDSKRLAELMREYQWSSPVHKLILEQAIGHNKVVLLDSSNGGTITILNEKLGEWDGGRWYSNQGYKIFKPTPGINYADYSCDPRGYLPRPPAFTPMGAGVLTAPEQQSFLDPIDTVPEGGIVTKIKYNHQFDDVSLTFDDGEILVMNLDELLGIYTEIEFSDKLRPNIDQTVSQWVIASDQRRRKKKALDKC